MDQDQLSGAVANQWGRDIGPRVGKALGGVARPSPANEFSFGQSRVVIKIARATTHSVGVTYLTLDRVDEVYGAWETEADVFDVWALAVALFREYMRPTASKGSAAGKVGLVRRSVFRGSWDVRRQGSNLSATTVVGRTAAFRQCAPAPASPFASGFAPFGAWASNARRASSRCVRVVFA